MSATTVMAGLLVALAGASAVLLGFAVVQLAGQVRMRSRVHALAAGWGQERQGARLLRKPDPLIGAKHPGTLDRWLLRALPGGNRLEQALADAGLAASLSRVLGYVAAAAACLCFGLLWLGAGGLVSVGLGTAVAVAGLAAFLASRKAQRRKAFETLLPEAIGLMVRGLRAGVPVSETIAEVGKEVADPVGGIFRRAHEQVRLGQPLEGALLADTAGLDSQSMNFLIVTLSVQRETGGNLAETLDKLEDIMRQREQMGLKIKAMSSEARASALIIASLPLIMAILMLLVSPDYILPLFTTAAGNVLLGGAALCLGTGGWLMAQLVRFEV